MTKKKMTHIDEGILLAFLDQEVPLDRRRSIERHLGSCEACLSKLTSLRSLSAHFAGAVAQLDDPPRARQPAIAGDRIPSANPTPPARLSYSTAMLWCPRASLTVTRFGFSAASKDVDAVKGVIAWVTIPSGRLCTSLNCGGNFSCGLC